MEDDAVGYEDRPRYCRQDLDLETKCPSEMCDRTSVYDLKKQEVWVKKAKTKLGGHFAPELAWWEESFNLAMRGIGNVSCQPVIDLTVHRCISRLYIEGTPYMLWK